MKRRLLMTMICICTAFGMTQVVSASSLEGEDVAIVSEESEMEETVAETSDDVAEVTPDDTSDTLVNDAEVPEVPATGWALAENGWQYFDGTAYKIGFTEINGSTYLFDENGFLLTGIQTLDGTIYYLSTEGESPEAGLGCVVVSQWIQTEDQSVYYFGETGAAVTGWQTLNGKTYYFDETTGKMATGFVKVGKYSFYFAPEGELGSTMGEMLLGWQDIEGKTYYFKMTGDPGIKGAMLTGIQKIGTRKYGFDKTTGAMLLGWQDINGSTYYFKWTGERGIKGVMLTGFQKIGTRKFYFDKTTGVMARGWTLMGKATYYFKWSGDPGVKGAMLTGFQNIGTKTYYFNTNGQMAIGWETINDKIFYFKYSGDPGVKGQMFTGKVKVGTKTFYFNPTGARGNKGKLLTGWRTINGKKYYFKKSGAIGTKGVMLTGWQKLNGSWYYLQSTGAMKTGWLKSSGKWYYLDTDGKMVTGWKYISVSGARYSSYKFFFNSDGTLMQDVSSKIGRQSSYYTEVDRTNCTVVVYAKDSTGQYRIPVKTMTCSVGLPGTETPTGTFSTSVKYRWRMLMGPSWGQYATRIVGGVLFHSVAGSAPNSYALPASEYNKLGQPASHGCVRLCVRDAKWIYDNCSLGMTVKIGDNLYQPFSKPATIKIPASQNWDPTDPAV